MDLMEATWAFDLPIGFAMGLRDESEPLEATWTFDLPIGFSIVISLGLSSTKAGITFVVDADKAAGGGRGGQSQG